LSPLALHQKKHKIEAQLNLATDNYCITEDALLNTPITALVMLGAATAIAMAIKANMMAYSTIVTPLLLFFFCINALLVKKGTIRLFLQLVVEARRLPKMRADTSKENDVTIAVIGLGHQLANRTKVLGVDNSNISKDKSFASGQRARFLGASTENLNKLGYLY
jgi:hypothetical protein